MLPLVVAADLVVGEPPARWHPVVWFGRLARALERRWYADSVRRGAVFWVVAVGAALLVGVGLDRALGRRGALAVSGTVCVAGRMLAAEVSGVGAALSDGDLALARSRVSRLVGRDTAGLGESDVARAAIETMAENTVDAVVASLYWGALGGAPAVLGHRAVNTLDAMVGARTARYERFGKVAAIADDVAAWVPARLAAVATATIRPSRVGAVVRAVHRDAGRHPSPNGGVVEAAFAASLGVTVGGVNRYGDRVEVRGPLGEGPSPAAADVHRSVASARRVVVVVAVGLELLRRRSSGPAS